MRGRGGKGTNGKGKAGGGQAQVRGTGGRHSTQIYHGLFDSIEEAAKKTVAKQELAEKEEQLRRSVILCFCFVCSCHCHMFSFTYALTQCQEDDAPIAKRPRRKDAAAADAPSEGEADNGEGDDADDEDLNGEEAEEGEEEEQNEPDEEVDEEDNVEPAAKAQAAKSQKSSRPKAEVPSQKSSSWSLPTPTAEAENPKTPNLVAAKIRVAVGAARKTKVLIICFGCSAKSTALLGKRSSLL